VTGEEKLKDGRKRTARVKLKAESARWETVETGKLVNWLNGFF
jgi:hypothetical protein